MNVAALLLILATPAAVKSSQCVRVESPLYVAWIDPETKLCERIEYTVRADECGSTDGLVRKFHTPPELRDVCLESADYEGSGYHRGHLRAVSLSAKSAYLHDVDCMAVIVPMTPRLNQSGFRKVEMAIAEFAKSGDVEVVISVHYEGAPRTLPGADEPHRIPSGFTVTATTVDHVHRWPLSNWGTE